MVAHPTDRITRAVAEQVAAERRVDVSRVDVDEIRRDVAEYRDLDRPQDAAMVERLTQLLAVLRFRDGGPHD